MARIFHSIVETIPEPLAVLDEDLVIRAANRSFYRHFAANPDDTENQRLDEVGNRQWDIPALRSKLETLVCDKTPVEEFEVDHEFPAIGRRVMVLNARILEDLDENRPLILIGMRDITVSRRSENEMKLLARQLERSNADLEEFARVVSHDLQEPLRKILAFGDRLRSAAADSLDEKSKDYLSRMLNASSRMHLLINDLLSYCRVQSVAAPDSYVNLDAVIREVLVDLEERIAETKASVVLQNALPAIEANPVQIRMLLQNLVANALKYHKKDAAPIVRISGKCEGGFVQLAVEDNGIGFEPKYQEKIFAIFQRLHGREEYSGSGIGLALCRKIVHRHGGKIIGRGSPGEGSIFTVTLPVRRNHDRL